MTDWLLNKSLPVEKVSTSSQEFQDFIELVKQSELNNISSIQLWLLQKVADWAYVLKENNEVTAWIAFISRNIAQIVTACASIENFLDKYRRATHEKHLRDEWSYLAYEAWKHIATLLNAIEEKVYLYYMIKR